MDFHAEYEQRSKNHQSDIYAHLPLLYHHASGGDCQIVELGVRGGDSTVAFLAAIQANGGYLWSCDVSAPPFANSWQEAMGGQWEFVHGDDLERFAYAPDDVDIVFIDTSHTYHQTVAELDLYHTKLRPGGVILLHDVELKAPADSPASDPDYPVRVAVEEFADEHGWDVEFVKGCYGLGILRAPKASSPNGFGKKVAAEIKRHARHPGPLRGVDDE